MRTGRGRVGVDCSLGRDSMTPVGKSYNAPTSLLVLIFTKNTMIGPNGPFFNDYGVNLLGID